MADKTLTKDQLIEAIKGMTVLELSEMVKALEEEFGVSAARPRGRRSGCRRRAGRGRRRADRVRRHAHRLRRPEDPGHQGGARAHRSRSQGGQGRRRGRPQAPSRKASPRTRPKRSRRSSKRPARASRSSRGASTRTLAGPRRAGPAHGAAALRVGAAQAPPTVRADRAGRRRGRRRADRRRAVL